MTTGDWDSNSINIAGVKAIRATAPTNTKAHISEALIQLALGQEIPEAIGRSFIPLIESKLDAFQRLGKEYLNLQFGWSPFVDDLKELLLAVQSSAKLVKQYERDAGRFVRRSYEFAPDSTVTARPPKVGGGIAPLTLQPQGQGLIDFYGKGSVSGGTLYCTEEVIHRYYFSGAYTYFLPPLEKDPRTALLSHARRATSLLNHLGGTSVTPSTIWEAAPWTWLSDWFSDIGGILANVSNFQTDNLILRWGYLQRYTYASRVYQFRGMKLTGGVPLDSTTIFTTVKKERAKATPYGFGVDPATFSEWQWSILAALGLTLGPHKMRI
jgi:hypothetical protein